VTVPGGDEGEIPVVFFNESWPANTDSGTVGTH